jgi:hypothetical protein
MFSFTQKRKEVMRQSRQAGRKDDARNSFFGGENRREEKVREAKSGELESQIHAETIRGSGLADVRAPFARR